MSSTAIDPGFIGQRLPVLGNIKIGGLKAEKRKSKGDNEWQAPERYDHFVITKLERGEDGNLIRDEAVHEVLGPKPTELDVHLPFETRAENLRAQMVHYQGRTTKTRQCDGVICLDPRTEQTKPCDARAGRECPCKPYARLNVFLDAARTFGQLHVFRTTSKVAVPSMQTILMQLEENLGGLRGLPMQLKIYSEETTYRDEKGNSHPTTVKRVALVLRASFEEARAQMIEYHRQNQIAKRHVLQITSGQLNDGLDEIDRIEEKEIGAEYFPTQASPPEPKRSSVGDANRRLEEASKDETPIDELIHETRALMEGLELRPTDLKSLNGAIERKDAVQLRTGIQWLKDRAEKKEKAPATQDEIAELERVEHMAVARKVVTEDEGRSIAEAAAAGDGPMVRSWTRALWDRLQKETSTDDAGEQTSLLGGES